MRVTGGIARGHRLKVPRGSLVRPTTDMVRKALFSILETTASDWSRVLDLYAGSGALGIEALSRGAGWSDFVDQEPKCCAIIKDNLNKTGLMEKTHIYCNNVAKALTFLNTKYDIIFMDPPYSDTSISNLLHRLAISNLVGTDSLVAVTHSHRLPLNDSYDGLRLIKAHRHGDTCISIYQKKGQS